jgi:hypothetical protein
MDLPSCLPIRLYISRRGTGEVQVVYFGGGTGREAFKRIHCSHAPTYRAHMAGYPLIHPLIQRWRRTTIPFGHHHIVY